MTTAELPLDQILDECIQRMLVQGASMAECLAKYPEHAAVLGPELQTIRQVLKVSGGAPSAVTKARGRARLQAELRTLRNGEVVQAGRTAPIWRRLVFAAGAGLATVFAVTTVVSASSDALPGDTLYPVKQGVRQGQLAAAFSETRRVDVNLGYAGATFKQAAHLAEAGSFSSVPGALQLAQAELREAAERAAAAPVEKRSVLKARIQAAALEAAIVVQAISLAPGAEETPAVMASVAHTQATLLTLVESLISSAPPSGSPLLGSAATTEPTQAATATAAPTLGVPTATPVMTLGEQPTPGVTASGGVVVIAGIVQSIDSSALMVNGVSVALTPATAYVGSLQVGERITLRASVSTEGGLVAIDVVGEATTPKPTVGPAPTATSPTPVAPLVPVPPVPVEPPAPPDSVPLPSGDVLPTLIL